MKILFAIDTLERGGTEQSLLELSRGLVCSGFDVHICQFYSGDSLAGEFSNAGVSVHALGVDRKYGFKEATAKFTRLVTRIKPALIHSSLFRSNQITRRARGKVDIPLVSSFVNTPYSCRRLSRETRIGRLKVRRLQLLDRRSSNRVSRFHSVSEFVANENCSHLGIDRTLVEVIPRGRNPERFAPCKSSRQALRRELGCDDNTQLLMSVGRLVTQKNTSLMIDAVKKIVETGIQNVKLVIAGDGPLRPELQARIHKTQLHRHVQLLGVRSDIPDLLNAADLFMFSSEYEGMPGAVIEAMMSSLPIVSTNIPMIAEFLVDNEMALLYPVGDVDALAVKTRKLLTSSELRSQLVANAHGYAVEHLSTKSVVRKMAEFYEHVVSEDAVVQTL